MRRLIEKLAKSRTGMSTVEFALAAPILLMFIIGLIQLGVLFGANAGLKHAVDEGARYATIYPRPTDDDIKARVSDKKFMLQSSYVEGPDITRSTSNGATYAEITMKYNVPLNFVFFTVAPVKLTQTRRAYQY